MGHFMTLIDVKMHLACYNAGQGSVSPKSRKLFGPEKPFRKLLPAHSVKMVFPYVVKGIKIKITAKFCASRHLRFEDTKKIVSPEMRPKSFGTFEKQAPDLDRSNNSTKLYFKTDRLEIEDEFSKI